jgi:hypothetical protein
MPPRPPIRSVSPVTTDPALDALQAQRRAVIRWLRPLAPLILAVVAVSAFTSSPRPGWHDRGLAVTITLAVVLLSGAAAVLLANRAVLVVVLLASSAVLAWLQPSGAGIAGVFVGLSLLAPMFRGHRSVPLIIVATVLVAVTFASGRHDSIISALLTAIMIAAFYGMLLLAIRLADAKSSSPSSRPVATRRPRRRSSASGSAWPARCTTCWPIRCPG